jgi:hypothetical protein
MQCSHLSRSPEFTDCSYALSTGFCQMSSNFWWNWSCSNLQQPDGILPHCDMFPRTSVGCCWISVNVPCWIPSPHRPSTGGHTSSSGGVSPAVGGGVYAALERKFTAGFREGFSPGLEFCVALPLLTGPRSFPQQIALWVPCGLGTNLLHTVLVLKASALPALLGEPVLDSALVMHKMWTCKSFSTYSVASLDLDLGRVLHLVAYGAWDTSFQGPQFPPSFRLWEPCPEFRAVSKPSLGQLFLKNCLQWNWKLESNHMDVDYLQTLFWNLCTCEEKITGAGLLSSVIDVFFIHTDYNQTLRTK